MLLFLLGLISMPVVAILLSRLWVRRTEALDFHCEDDHQYFERYVALGNVWQWAAISGTINSLWTIVGVIFPDAFGYNPPLEYGLLGGILIMVVAMITAVFLTKNKD